MAKLSPALIGLPFLRLIALRPGVPLWAMQEPTDVTMGVSALGFRGASPRLPSREVLRVIAMHLRDAVSEASSGGLGSSSRRRQSSV